jgi:protein-tyrosine phosphatase
MINNNMAETKPGRLLPLRGLYNLRDLGGYPLKGGRRVRWGLLYRGGDFDAFTPEDRDVLEKRNIKTIVDFRDKEERDLLPDGTIGTVTGSRWLPIDAGNIPGMTGSRTKSAGEALMEKLYRILAEQARSQYREFFTILSNPANTPLLFHCSAGKDRTGLGAALILSALGAERETVFEDYLLSAECLKGKYQTWIASDPCLESLMSVRRPYLEAAFDTIDRNYGGMDRYLRDELGADPGLLRDLYTETGY